MRSRASAADLLRVAAIEPDGLLVGQDGVYVRYLEVGSVNPLVLDPQECERISGAFAQVAARLEGGQCLQLYAQSTPLDLEELLARETQRGERAAGAAEDAGEMERATAIRRLGVAQEVSLRATAQTVAPVSVRYLVVCPWRPAGVPLLRSRTGRRPLRIKAAVHERAKRDSHRHAEGIAGDLEAAGVGARPLDGGEVLDLLHARFDPDAQAAGRLPASFLCPQAVAPVAAGEAVETARRRVHALARAVCSAHVSFAPRTHLRIGESAEEVFFVSWAPEQTWLGWLLHMMQAPRPFVVSVHIAATDRFRERMAQKRRHRRIHGINRGVEQHGRPVDPDAQLQEQEAQELNDELAGSPGAGIYRVSIYASLREPGPEPDVEALHEHCRSTGREVTMTSDARIGHGPFAQRALWQATLPLGRDVARRRRRYLGRNVGDTFQLTGTSCGSADGIPLGYAVPGRTLERLDPFDPVLKNNLLLVNGTSGSGKTMAVILLLLRAIAQGAAGAIIDRAGHFAFPASLIPGAVSLVFGGEGGAAINSWDVEDAANVSAEKIDYLLALHALLLGEHHPGRDSYGLSDLESNLLALAIAEVYARCALTGEEPRELLLQEELERRYRRERQEGSVGVAESLRNLSTRLSNYIGEGPYAYLADRPTSIPTDAPLVVFDTCRIPEAKAAAALFVICEYVKSQIERTRRRHLAGESPRHAWAGRRILVVDEAWKLIERPATGRWFNEFARRSRHFGLWLVAISQQLSDFDCEHGKALLANAEMRLFLRQEARELAYARQALALSEEAIEAISSLRTVRGAFSTTYLMNGPYGAGVVQIGVGALDYWIATSEPTRDAPLREHALRASGQRPWSALELLVDEEWRQRAALELESRA
jgi:hypothetical protein